MDQRDNTERTDRTGFGDIVVIQHKGFGYGVDSVLLTSFAAGETGAKRIRNAASAADLGTGCGIVAFAVAHKIPGIRITGIEKNPDAADRARRACAASGLDDRVSIICSDIKDVHGKHDLDAVVSNPPYFRRMQGHQMPEKTDERFTSRHETTADIWDFARAASSMLKRGGSFYLVHRPDRLADIFAAMRESGIEPKEMQMAAPVYGQAANIVLIHGIKDAGPELRILPEIYIRDEDGNYTPDILRFYERD